jgi:peroxiredoxin
MWDWKMRIGSWSVTFRVGLVCCVVAWLNVTPVHAEPARAGNLQQVLDTFELSNNYGKSIALREFADKPLIVLAFLGTECPLAKLYGPRLNELQEKFAAQGVQVIGVNSNKQDSLTELTAYVHRSQIDFPMLKDVGNKLADAIGATRTPEIFLLDRQRDVRYHGRIDDQYSVGVARPEAQRADLELAIEELLAGKPVSQAEAASVGCYIGRVKAVESAGEVTYTKHIAPILNARCVECHRVGEIGPFTLTSYEDLLGWEDTILEVIADNRMPPWNANPAYGHFKNDARLSASEIELIRQWIAGGMPPGDPQDLPEPPQFVEGWKIGQPEQVIYMDDVPFTVPAQGTVDYQRFLVDPGWTEDKYIDAAEARPDNRAVVHHILAYIIPPGARRVDLQTILVGYAPGSLPVQLEDGLAIRVPAGSKLLFEMHYTPNGSQQTDRSYIGVRFTSQDKVSKLLQGQAAMERRFEIPAGAEAHEVTAEYRSRQDELLISMTPHMHLRGKAFRYQAIYPDGSQEILLDVPKYDFNWQLKYVLAEPKKLPRGTKVVCTAVYDNSAANLANPDPSRAVRWGDQSWQEMMIGFFDTVAVD